MLYQTELLPGELFNYLRVQKKRKTGFEPATPTMARWCSTTELLPHFLLTFCIQSGKQDSNLRPPGPKPGALPSWAISRYMHPVGVEPTTFWFVVRHSIQLRYGCIFHYDAEDRNRTGTVVTYRGILSPVRLPVPPPRLNHNESGRRDSNPRPPPWQGDVLPLNYFRILMPTRRFERPTLWLQIRCSTNWAKSA